MILEQHSRLDGPNLQLGCARSTGVTSARSVFRSKSLKPLRLLSLATLALLTSRLVCAQPAPYTFTKIDFPGTTGGTYGMGINSKGQFVGTYFVPGFDFKLAGFVYDRGAFITIEAPVPNVDQTQALSINEKGQVVGHYIDAVGFHGFLYEHGVASTLDVPFAGATDTVATGINNQGDIVGSYSEGDISRSFLYTHGKFLRIDLPFPQDISYTVIGINERRQLVGSYSTPPSSFSRAFFYDGRQLLELGTPTSEPVTYMWAGDINDRGQIVGTYVNFHVDGYVLDRGTFVTIEIPSSLVFEASHGQHVNGINSRGELVGDYDDNLGAHAFLAIPH